MSEASESEAKRKSRLRWITLGEAIAIAALVISGIGLWHEFTKPNEKPVVVEKQASIPLRLRGRVVDEGRSLEITPVEPGHALQSMYVSVGGLLFEVGSDGDLKASAFEDGLRSGKEDEDTHRLRIRIQAKYVEAGADKFASGYYTLTYRWEGGGLLGRRSLRLVNLSR